MYSLDVNSVFPSRAARVPQRGATTSPATQPHIRPHAVPHTPHRMAPPTRRDAHRGAHTRHALYSCTYTRAALTHTHVLLCASCDGQRTQGCAHSISRARAHSQTQIVTRTVRARARARARTRSERVERARQWRRKRDLSTAGGICARCALEPTNGNMQGALCGFLR